MQRENKEVESFYKSKEWQKTRNAYITYRKGVCERCYSPGVIVHHKKYITINNIHYPEITLSFDNLELLCRKCHNVEHMKKIIPYEFDEDGNLIVPPSPPQFLWKMETDERAFKE